MNQLFNIAVGNSAQSVNWKNERWDWPKMVNRLSKVVRTPEVYVNYMKSNKTDQGIIKDVGGFVGGYLSNGKRKKENVVSRSLITLDLDFAPLSLEQWLEDNAPFTYVLHSTHKHSAATPRYRLIIPIDREVTADEYQAIARKVAECINIEFFDTTTFDTNRLMFWPSCSIDAEYVFRYKDGSPICADQFLAMYKNWRDVSEWAFSAAQREIRQAGARQENPLDKDGIVGAFCRCYSIKDAIGEFLSDKYEGEGDRYTYLLGSTTGGAIVYDDLFIYSHHGTDPAQGQLCNAFDLVRLHKYGNLDEANSRTSGKNTKSFTAMAKFARELPKVRRLLVEEQFNTALKEFNIIPSEQPQPVKPEPVTVPNMFQTRQAPTPTVLEKTPYETARPEVQASLTQAFGPFAQSCTQSQVTIYDMITPLPVEIVPEPEPTAEDITSLEWAENMEVDSKGVLTNSARNILLILENDPNLKACFGYNRFDNRRYILKSVPWRTIFGMDQFKDVDFAGVRSYIERTYGISSPSKIDDALYLIFDKYSFNPVTDYLDTLVWDGVPRINTLLSRCFGADQNAYTAAALRKSLVAAVNRAYKPGTKFDMVLTLVGEEGSKKSTFLKKLGRSWFSDSFNSIEGNRSFEQLQGVWLMEMGELAGLRKAEVEAIKHYITKETDSFRPAYGRTTETFQRTCIFFATTNDRTFLKSTTGNRRWNPITVRPEHVTLDVFSIEFEDMINQIWAEAKCYYHLGEQLIFNAEEKKLALEAQEQHTDKDERTGIIEAYINKPLPAGWDQMTIEARRLFYATDTVKGIYQRTTVSAIEVWCECFGKNKSDFTTQVGREINNAIRQIKGVEMVAASRVFGEYGRQRYYEINTEI